MSVQLQQELVFNFAGIGVQHQQEYAPLYISLKPEKYSKG
jgi:hypothetical protein